MKSYVPNTQAQREEMLHELGLNGMEELFADIPQQLRLNKPLALGMSKSETEVRRIFDCYKRDTDSSLSIFRGAGAYRHYIPAAIPQLVMQSSFYTAYTPYQPEMSQGMLQAIFEYQSLICELTGMDAANASVYDGATAAAETVKMLAGAKRKNKVLYSLGLHPDVIQAMKTYSRFNGTELVGIPLNSKGVTDTDALAANMDGAAGFISAQPNFYGCLEDMPALCALTHEKGGLFAAYVNPVSLGLIKRPGDYDADFAIGEGQPLGMPLSFGGPYLGIMAAKQKYIRNLPGRIAGQTQDHDGNRAFVLTLQAREQHIRRENASSNICSNQMLCALTASIYLSLMGPQGIKETAEQCVQKAHYLADGISHIKGMRMRYDAPFFHEFVVDSDIDPVVLDAKLIKRGILGGLPLSRFDAKDNGILYCATEMNTRDEIDELLNALEVAK